MTIGEALVLGFGIVAGVGVTAYTFCEVTWWLSETLPDWLVIFIGLIVFGLVMAAILYFIP